VDVRDLHGDVKEMLFRVGEGDLVANCGGGGAAEKEHEDKESV
jgi:hypothetical protein